jgi:hypothetical protein
MGLAEEAPVKVGVGLLDLSGDFLWKREWDVPFHRLWKEIKEFSEIKIGSTYLYSTAVRHIGTTGNDGADPLHGNVAGARQSKDRGAGAVDDGEEEEGDEGDEHHNEATVEI